MPRRAGWTLADVVVIIVVVLTALGLLVTYVLRQRETAMRVQCADNLRRLGNAVRSFHDFARAAEEKPRRFLPPSRLADGYATWAVLIAPHLVQKSPLADWDVRQSYVVQPPRAREAILPVFFCPARLRVRTTLLSTAGDVDPATGTNAAGALGDYAGVAGTGSAQHDWTGPDADGSIILAEVLAKDNALITAWRGRVSLDDLVRGQSYTLLLGEKHVPPSGFGLAEFGDSSLYNGAVPASCTRVGGPGHGLAPDATAPYRTNFGSYHPDICLFIQADIGLRTMSVTVDENLLGRLTRRGE
jgi:hypothetical protein